MRERKNQEMLQQMITEGKQIVGPVYCSSWHSTNRSNFQEADLAEKSEKFKSLTSELDDLYTNIFGGTTTGRLSF